MAKEFDAVDQLGLVNDGAIARLVCMSKSWVRKERFNRRHGLAHTLSLDPVMIGRCPRYRWADVQAWLECQGVRRGEAAGA